MKQSGLEKETIPSVMECAGSHLRGSCLGPATLRCGSCGAVRYCSRQHQKRHWSEHAQVCSRMAEQMQRAPELYDFPFSFAHQTTRMLDAEEEVTYCSLLESWGLHGVGLWTASCDCFRFTEGAIHENGDWRLSFNSCPCKPPEDSPPGQLQSWREYYDWRGIQFNSPVALILHWPLSLYHAICMSQLQISISKPLRVHYLGPERELHQLPAFGELLALFPGVNIHIDFVGPAVVKDVERLELSTFGRCSDVECACQRRDSVLPKGRITVRLWRGMYHDRHPELGITPDLIFAANAGIAAFSSWHPTLRLMESLNVPALFTDYCEEAAVMAVQTIQYVFQGKHPGLAFLLQVNPFRQPLSSSNHDLDLPTFSNAFIFGVKGPLNAAPFKLNSKEGAIQFTGRQTLEAVDVAHKYFGFSELLISPTRFYCSFLNLTRAILNPKPRL